MMLLKQQQQQQQQTNRQTHKTYTLACKTVAFLVLK